MSTVYREEVPAHLMTVAQLRSSGRRPHDPGVASGWLERVFEGDVWRTPLYDVRSARPLPAPTRPPAPPSAPAVTAPSSRAGAAAWARDVLRARDAVVLDTELTDFAGRVIEVAVLSVDGTVLLSTLVDPAGAPINPHAQRKHGISPAVLAGAPTMAQVWPRLEEALRDKVVIAWNAPFDQARLRDEHQRVVGGAALPEWLARPWECAMRRHAAWVGESNGRGSGYRNHKLEGGHRAEGDCRAVLDRLRQMASTTPGGAARVEPAPVDESDGEHHHRQGTRRGTALDDWIRIAPGRICGEVAGPAGAAPSGDDGVDAFHAVDHTARCAPDAVCRTVLRLADGDRFDEAVRLVEEHVLAP
ncbi:3'-5' exonuclease [Saccharothrix sp. MB29]|nr:3'-5' exonuclease [Saccharothrix sp. MB29]